MEFSRLGFKRHGPPEYLKKAEGYRVTGIPQSTFCRVNLSLASCSSAELVSVSVRNKKPNALLYLQTVKKADHLHNDWKFGAENSNLLLHLKSE